jgi:hypothetical protein
MATINSYRNLNQVTHGFEMAIQSEIGFTNHFNGPSLYLIEMMCTRLLDILAEYQFEDLEFSDFLLGWYFADKLTGRISGAHSFMNTLIESHFEYFGKLNIDHWQGEIALDVIPCPHDGLSY